MVKLGINNERLTILIAFVWHTFHERRGSGIHTTPPPPPVLIWLLILFNKNRTHQQSSFNDSIAMLPIEGGRFFPLFRILHSLMLHFVQKQFQIYKRLTNVNSTFGVKQGCTNMSNILTHGLSDL